MKGNISTETDVVGCNPDRIIMQGPLYKKGSMTKIWKARWYVLKDKFLYHYKIAKPRESPIGEPINLWFIQGCRAVVDETESEKCNDKFFFTIVFPNGKDKRMYAKSYKDGEFWVQSLLQAGGYGEMNKFYTIHDKIGKGKFSDVYKCTEKKTNEQWAVKVIDKK